MKNLDDLFQTIESHEFSALVNLASSFKTFLGILSAESPMKELAQQMHRPEVRTAVGERALALVTDVGEGGYEHPWDSALAAYLWLLADADAALATRNRIRRCGDTRVLVGKKNGGWGVVNSSRPFQRWVDRPV
jgi:hypothetical protein